MNLRKFLLILTALFLAGCRNINVFVFTIPFPPSVVQTNTPFDIYLLTAGMVIDSNRANTAFPKEFRYDSIVIAACLPPGWTVNGITYDFNDDGGDFSANPFNMADSVTEKQFTEMMFTRHLPYSTVRAAEYDAPLAAST